MDEIIYTIGQHGPVILMVVALYTLWGKSTMVSFVFLGQIVNWFINAMLKFLIKQPRPTTNDPSYVLDRMTFAEIVSRDPYGMPSGHAQTSAFVACFVYLVTRDVRWTLFSVCILFITMWQRVEYDYHTLLQVSVGAAVGTINAVICFWLATKYKKLL
jgi:membrane-associated phospholipid phosphatase